jgi:hypothetical protein
MKPFPLVSRIVPGDPPLTMPGMSLLFANGITIAFAILQHWDLATVMFIYWAQSIIIGFFAVITILTTDAASFGFSSGTNPVFLNYMWLGKLFIAGFFILHYGLFHLAYFSFIVESGIFGPVNPIDSGILIACGLFFANHLH